MKTEKKSVQFSEDIQVETIEPEQEPVYIDEVGSLLCFQSLFSFSNVSLYELIKSSKIGSGISKM